MSGRRKDMENITSLKMIANQTTRQKWQSNPYISLRINIWVESHATQGCPTYDRKVYLIKSSSDYLCSFRALTIPEHQNSSLLTFHQWFHSFGKRGLCATSGAIFRKNNATEGPRGRSSQFFPVYYKWIQKYRFFTSWRSQWSLKQEKKKGNRLVPRIVA